MSTSHHPKLDIFLQLVTSVATIIASFVLPPPGHSLAPQWIDWKHAWVFIAALLIGLMWHRLANFRDHWPFLLGASFVLFLIYTFLLMLWTCELEQGRVVIGADGALLPAGKQFLAQTGNDSCQNLLLNFASDPRVVYASSSLYGHEVLLGGMYVVLATMLSVCVVLLEHKLTQDVSA
jgi:hypothetical protein